MKNATAKDLRESHQALGYGCGVVAYIAGQTKSGVKIKARIATSLVTLIDFVFIFKFCVFIYFLCETRDGFT